MHVYEAIFDLRHVVADQLLFMVQALAADMFTRGGL